MYSFIIISHSPDELAAGGALTQDIVWPDGTGLTPSGRMKKQMGLLYGEISRIDHEPNVVDVLPLRIARLLITGPIVQRVAAKGRLRFPILPLDRSEIAGRDSRGYSHPASHPRHIASSITVCTLA
jgi:hypothetical protein